MRPDVVFGSHSGRIVRAERRRGALQPPPGRDSTSSTSIPPPGPRTWYATAARPVVGWIPTVGRKAWRRVVTRAGGVQDKPSSEVETTTLFVEQPALKRQSCQVTQIRPLRRSTSAAGSGKKRRPLALRAWTSETASGTAKVAPPSVDTEASMLSTLRR